MEKSMARIAKTTDSGSDAAQVMTVMLRKIAGFSGLVQENMYRATGWQFLSIGRSLERAAMMADLLAVFADKNAPDGGLDLAIEVGDSIMVHRQRYAVLTSRDSVIDLLGLDASNPRSIHFQLDMIRQRAADLAANRPLGQMSDFDRHVLELQTTIAVHSVRSLNTKALLQIKTQTLDLSTALNAAFMH
jgi:uncharacterized alpha-E superfamily protein